MSAWEYGWLAQTGKDLETGEQYPHVLYMRTMWEDSADGMGRPHSEVLGLICLRESIQAWDVYLPMHRSLFARADGLEAAKQVIKDYYKRHPS